ncbi:SDR family NAD(P)-dependent oxidoreductase [Allosphingosinicella deserti]|uniref:Oxidoreductase n=1 Tax=Allosphingosinicella deserti TaxID=2116704 RepID=A0A2P7QM62_9SPHN|nr:SDR family oxidoreductase [Sphingomonas deserti]PSJ39053.1 oxidoreductase [Sphingomonas deserti]
MTKRLIDKVAVITGGTTGIGLAVAQRFAAEGASVFITGRRQAELDTAVASIGHGAVGVRADMSLLADIDRLFDAVQQKHAQIDVLMANAGGGTFAPLGAITEEDYERTFGTNVKGTIFTVQKALPLLKDGASIILTGSSTTIKGTAAFSIYSATKAAVRNLARSWMLDLKDRGIRVNVISPGPIETPGLLGLAADAEQERELRAGLSAAVPLGRLGRPEEVANMALFLASDESSFVNGAELFVDGGEVQF